MTYGKKGASAPGWSPDGTWMIFISSRGEGKDTKPQIWVMRSNAGEAWKLTDTKEGVSSYAWAQDGKTIAFTTRDPLSDEEEAERKRHDDPEIYENDFRSVHIWTVDIDTKDAVQRTKETEMIVRGRPSWSPDGKRLAFQAAPTPLIRDERDDLFILDLESETVERVTTALAAERSPAWSPDGKTIAFVTERNPNPALPDGMPLQRVGNATLMLYDVASKKIKDLGSSDFDLSAGTPVWTADSRRILFSTGARVYRTMFAYDLESKKYVPLTKGKDISFGSTNKDGSRATFLMDSSSEPPEVHVSALDFTSPQKLTDTNPQIKDLALGQTEVITWKSDDGLEIEGLLLKPAGFQNGRRYPLLVVVHGGPTGAYVDTFMMSRGDSGQHWAGQGWAVLYPNPRGSTNYGEKFMRANVLDWGGGDYRDIMTGVDAVVERGIADPEKLAVMGWSYGGYMTCWIVSQTGRFKAAMMGAGLSNLPSMYGTNDIPNYLGAFFNGVLSKETYPLYRERSGVTHVDQVTTPLLILHGGNDQRVPVGQPMEFFRALKDRGKTVELVFYPREGHGLREYYHRLDRLERQYEWITRHTLGRPETN
jgi:dipeptidyl aminopeptidase/acylaminoacyl peptidase